MTIVHDIALMSGASVQRLEDAVADMPQVECPIRHIFAPGVYMREMKIPKGTVAVGAVHKTEHVSIISGHCFVTTDDGVQEFEGYATVMSKAGAKRAAYAVEDTLFTTIHPTNETDLDKLCELLTFSKSDELLGGTNNRQLLANKKESPCLGES